MSHHTIPTIETERLLLRALTPEDAEDYHAAVAADPDVMKYLPGGVPRPFERTLQSIAFFEQTWRDAGLSGLGVVVKAENRLIGQCGLIRIPGSPDDAPEVEVFYAIAKAYWGQGIVTEAARAMLAYGFTQAGLERIIAVAAPQNTASRRVMEKLGMQFEGITSQYYNADLAYYSLTRADWQAINSAAS
jgi:ribosomal-protein-alanine N-acetyltransferase